MSNEMKIKGYKARIELLRSRTGRENGNIIKKLERKVRKLEREG